MKKHQLIITLLTLIFGVLPKAALSQTSVNQPQFGQQTVYVSLGQEILFYDHHGTDDISPSNSNNAQSLTVFQPAESGMAIQITFLECDVQNENKEWADYPGEVRIFNGNPDPGASYEWPTLPNEVTDALPEGEVLDVLDGIYTNKTYVSTTDDGILSVGLIWHYAKRCKGWKAVVTCVEKKNMVVTGARTDYSLVDANPSQRQGVNFASVIVDTDGTDYPDVLTSVSYRLDIDELIVDGEALRLYAGDGANRNGSRLVGEYPSVDGDGYTITLDHALQHGENRFTLSGDIDETAAIGGRAQVTITKVCTQQHPEGLSLEQGAATIVTNPAVVIMTTEPQTYSVGDAAIMLYDDGGKDGQITAGYNGSVTFVPANATKKILIDFNKIALANGSIYYQYIEVYNGTQMKKDNLLKTLRHGETCSVRSTAADGSLTVFLGNNGTQQTADGIEAMVTQFTPQPMVLDQVNVSHPSIASVCADDKGQDIMLIDVTTTNTEPALTAEAFTFSTAGTWKNLSSATLYYAGNNGNREEAQIVGTAPVTADDFTITLNQPLTLFEGDNFFFLAYDISDEAEDGTTVDASLNTVVLSGVSHAVSNGNPTGQRPVENIVYCYADQGTQQRTVNNSLTFRTRDTNEYQHLYEAGNDERITIFRPKHEGMVCQIDFSEFGLQYTNSLYGGVKSIFKIISGSNPNGPVLWELNNVDDKDVGPNKIVRSTAADGSLTIFFCPNDWNYNSTGWTAEVSEYLSQPMAVEKVDVAQTTTDIVPNHAKDIDLLTLNITAKGDLSVISLNSITIDTKESPLSQLSLYYIGRSDGDVNTPSVGTATVGTDHTVITLTTPLQLQEGSNYFRVRGNVSDEAEGEDEIDARIVSINAGGNDVAVAAGDPDGVRIVKDIYLMAQGYNDAIGVKHGQHILFYDDGGETGKATKKFEGTLTFYPKTEGEKIRFDFQQLDLGTKDTLYVYNGGSVDEGQLMAALSGANAQADYFVSSTDDGKLTVRFVVKSSFTAPNGFAIDVSAYAEEPQTINEVSITATSPEKVLQGATDVLLYTLGVNVAGEADKMALTRFDLDITGGDNIERVSVYTTDTDNTFTPMTLFGEATGGSTAIEGNYPMEKEGTYYFHIAIDVKSDAPAGSEIVITPTNIHTDRQDYTLQETTTTVQVAEGFKGTLTVGQGGDYGTIQAAVDAVSGGISGPTTISILPGIYNEKVKVPAIPGTSANNPLVIESQTGSWEDVKIYFDRYEEPPYSDDKMKYEYGVMTIAGCDYVTLRHLDITTEDLTFPGVVHVTGESRHLTIDHCHIHCTTSTSYSTDIKLVNCYAENEANKNNDYLTIRNSLLDGGYIGVRMGGTGYVALPKERGGIVEDNTFVNQGSKAIYVMEESGVKVRRNTIRAQQTGNGYRGIDFQVRDTYDESAVIEGNHLYLQSNADLTGIHIRLVNGTAENPVQVFNNEVAMSSNTTTSYGMVVNSHSSHLHIAHNTVVVGGSKSGATFWVNDMMGDDVEVVNNLFQNSSQGFAYRLRNASDAQQLSLRHQVAHTNGSQYAYVGGTSYPTQSAWAAVSGESDGQDEEVGFLHSEILEPAESGVLVSGEVLPWVSTDITGTTRGEQPTVGAYEYQADDRQPQMNEGYPSAIDITDTTARITLDADMNSEAFVVIVPAVEPAPSVDDVLTSEQVIALHKDTENSYVATELTTGETYVAYVVLRSLRGTESILYSTDAFVTQGHELKEMEAPEVVISGDTTTESGQSAILVATISGGTSPYEVKWLNGKHEVMSSAHLELNPDAWSFVIDDISFTPEQCDDYIVVVTDANGIEGRDTTRVIVTGEAIAATFENLYLDEESYWYGTDQRGSFVSGSYMFDNTNMPEWSYWSDFGYANRTATNFVSLYPDQFNNAVGGGHDGSENYVVAYPYSGRIHVMNKEADVLRGFYVTNDAWTVDAILHGDGMTPGVFHTGDYLKMTITGTHLDGTTATKEYYLADYRDADEAEHYYLDTWQWVDLRSLGEVSTISFKMEGNRANQYGLTTPAYFCLDDFNGERKVKDVGTVVIDDELDIASLFDPIDTAGRIVYDFADQPEQEVLDALELTPEGTLYVSGYSEPFELVLQAVQRGKIQFVKVRVEVNTPSSIAELSLQEADIEGFYTLDGKRCPSHMQPGVYVVKMKDGRVIKVKK